ncbi:hypothetical protein VOLCADRAFT_105587 [Volvox carteri f. nagariensis]|uniref:Endoplasmic reticulum transmembrane protein n=1 Tax=Volvox carteri f. nagariensis TaxID=3068 RepID=D8U1P5_VOLCA|nr:uncharacterized protein VOLCADRAFT_105587 [Volvox carteri f. nagariensis]EFJ46447.1 hypothetical protein VOLCADRAFT_105587 [Volvox carteri f. nagariensis]|eukprot:XP_002952600.1 hypothetical protein VOLCADRAFT_105587 [Volvox carteri f. nagariensis]
MDTIFTLPLFILAVFQAFLTVLHVTPGLGLPLSQTLRLLSRNTASRSVIYTLMGALALLSASSMFELSKGADKIRSGNLRGSERCKLDHTQKNLSAMQRQVKGLQAEYDRVTSTDKAAEGKSTAATAAADEAAALKKTLDKLIAEKQQLQAAVEAAEGAAKTADARVTAMVSQVKKRHPISGFFLSLTAPGLQPNLLPCCRNDCVLPYQGYDSEFDRLRDENTALRLQLQRVQPGALHAAVTAAAAPVVANKKDD